MSISIWEYPINGLTQRAKWWNYKPQITIPREQTWVPIKEHSLIYSNGPLQHVCKFQNHNETVFAAYLPLDIGDSFPRILSLSHVCCVLCVCVGQYISFWFSVLQVRIRFNFTHTWNWFQWCSSGLKHNAMWDKSLGGGFLCMKEKCWSWDTREWTVVYHHIGSSL